MIRNLHPAILVALVASGCAGAPGRDEVHAPLATAESAAVPPSGENSASAAPEPSLVVDINQLAARAGSEVVCRETLKQGSNVIVKQCMTADNWKEFERREARDAQEVVRMLQRGRYR